MNLTKEIFKNELVHIFDEDNIEDIEIEVVEWTTDEIEVIIKQMYEYINCSLENLIKVSRIVGTEKIDVDEWSTGGCETCDYGSSYEKTITITEFDPILFDGLEESK